MAQPQRLDRDRTWLIISLVVFIGYIPLLGWLPYQFAVPAEVSSAASAAGYSGRAATWIMGVWTLCGMVGAAVVAWLRRARGASPTSDPGGRAPSESEGPDGAGAETEQLAVPDRRTRLLEVLIVAIVVGLMYFPLFLAQYGPYIEDNIFLNALHRMGSGQQPFVDFEFLYGPLMIQAAWLWTKLFGYSMVSFYAYLALLEVLLFGVLTLILQRLIPERRDRYIAFLLLAALLFNALLGVNWSASRRLPAVLAVLATATWPRRTWAIVASGVLLGIQTAYSHDWGAVGLFAILAIHVFLFVRAPSARQVRQAVLTLVVAIAVWIATATLVLGDRGAYLAEIADLAGLFGAGEAGFRFYWTLNSLAAFALIAMATTLIGQRVLSRRGLEVGHGDLLLVGGFAFALFGMKSGLNRADLWHLDAPFLLLALALFITRGRRLFAMSGRMRRVSQALITVLAITYTVGQLPTISYFAQGWARGVSHVLRGGGSEVTQTVATRAPAIEFERAEPNPDLVRLAEYFAAPERVARPVLFYAGTWLLGMRIGVPRTDPLNDDFLYSDERGDRVREYLQANPDAFVVMSRDAYERLFGLADPDHYPQLERNFRDTPTKRIASWLSSVHFREIAVEHRLKDQRWRRTVGDYVCRNFVPVEDFESADFDSVVVLERAGAWAGSSGGAGAPDAGDHEE